LLLFWINMWKRITIIFKYNINVIIIGRFYVMNSTMFSSEWHKNIIILKMSLMNCINKMLLMNFIIPSIFFMKEWMNIIVVFSFFNFIDDDQHKWQFVLSIKILKILIEKNLSIFQTYRMFWRIYYISFYSLYSWRN
jgi:hypothetical protein